MGRRWYGAGSSSSSREWIQIRWPPLASGQSGERTNSGREWLYWWRWVTVVDVVRWGFGGGRGSWFEVWKLRLKIGLKIKDWVELGCSRVKIKMSSILIGLKKTQLILTHIIVNPTRPGRVELNWVGLMSWWVKFSALNKAEDNQDRRGFETHGEQEYWCMCMRVCFFFVKWILFEFAEFTFRLCQYFLFYVKRIWSKWWSLDW